MRVYVSSYAFAIINACLVAAAAAAAAAAVLRRRLPRFERCKSKVNNVINGYKKLRDLY